MTLLLNDTEIAAMRTTLERTLPDTAVVVRDTQVSDGAGGYTTTAELMATVACRVAVPSGKEETIAGKLDAVGIWTITLPALTDVTAPDRILVSTGGAGVFVSEGSRSFDVVLPLRPRSWELSRRVLAVEIL